MKLQTIVKAIRSNFQLSEDKGDAAVLICDQVMEHSKYMAQEMLIGIATQHGFRYKEINDYMSLSRPEYVHRETQFKRMLDIPPTPRAMLTSWEVSMTDRFHYKYKLVTNYLRHCDDDHSFRNILKENL